MKTLTLTLFLVLAVATPAHALEWNLRLDPAVAGHFDTITTGHYRRAGGGATLRGAIAPLSFLDVHLSLGVHAWATGVETKSGDDWRAWNVGAGIRLKRPWQDATVSPWIDLDLNYVNAGGDNRFGFSVGVGLAVALDEAKRFRIGPFLRYMQIVAPDGFTGSVDPKILMGGVSLEVGNTYKPSAKPEPTAPRPTAAPDRDGDGTPDGEDQCPDKPGPAANKGCPEILDRDHDGIVDELDKCPTEPEDKDGFEDEDGCPNPDNDKDGVLDADDKCPNVAGPAATHGCPDKDNDGVADEDDQCPDVAGPVDNHGCPVHKTVKVTETKLEVTQKVFFANKSAKILPKSFGLLDEVAAVLKEHLKFRIRVEGHTDSNGKHDMNMKLSDDRAKSVREYLVGKGVAADRLDAQGFGPDQPIDDNKTSKGRENNRRVEFMVLPLK